MVLLSAALLWSQAQADLEAARKEFEEVVRLDPKAAEAHARLGMVYRRLGMAAEAITSLERAQQLEPNNRLRVLLAFAYMDSGRYRDAAPLLAASFESEPKDAVRSSIGQRLVECYLALGDNEQALAAVQKLRQIAPDDPGVLYLSAKVYMNLWNGAFQRMLAKAPDSYQVRLIRAEALESQEKFAEATAEYRQLVKIAPSVVGIHYRLGVMIVRSQPGANADEEALGAFRKELEINPADVRALVEIGEIHLSRDRRPDATHSFERALMMQPGYVPARVGLAKVLIAEKQWPKALEHLEAAAKMAPDDEAVAYNLMIVYRALGRMDDAKRASDRFQQLRQQKQQR